jgi:hypothetical protein
MESKKKISADLAGEQNQTIEVTTSEIIWEDEESMPPITTAWKMHLKEKVQEAYDEVIAVEIKIIYFQDEFADGKWKEPRFGKPQKSWLTENLERAKERLKELDALI